MMTTMELPFDTHENKPVLPSFWTRNKISLKISLIMQLLLQEMIKGFRPKHRIKTFYRHEVMSVWWYWPCHLRDVGSEAGVPDIGRERSLSLYRVSWPHAWVTPWWQNIFLFLLAYFQATYEKSNSKCMCLPGLVVVRGFKRRLGIVQVGLK